VIIMYAHATRARIFVDEPPAPSVWARVRVALALISRSDKWHGKYWFFVAAQSFPLVCMTSCCSCARAARAATVSPTSMAAGASAPGVLQASDVTSPTALPYSSVTQCFFAVCARTLSPTTLHSYVLSVFFFRFSHFLLALSLLLATGWGGYVLYDSCVCDLFLVAPVDDPVNIAV
jgi:hypothetical protein